MNALLVGGSLVDDMCEVRAVGVVLACVAIMMGLYPPAGEVTPEAASSGRGPQQLPERGREKTEAVSRAARQVRLSEWEGALEMGKWGLSGREEHGPDAWSAGRSRSHLDVRPLACRCPRSSWKHGSKQWRVRRQ